MSERHMAEKVTIGNAELWHGDCLELMATLPDASVDMILCDLPYGTTACKWDTVIPFEPLWSQYHRIAKRNAAIVLTASQPFTTALIASNMKMFKYCWVWEKSRATDFLNAKNKPMKKHEDVCVFSHGTTANKSDRRMDYYPQGLVERREEYFRPSSKRKNGGVVPARPSHVQGYVSTHKGYPTSVLKFANPSNNNVHPTQKPVALMEYLIRTYTNEGDTVMDNCMGSGTTGVACVSTGREFIGIEQDDKYFDIACERIARARAQGQLIPHVEQPPKQAAML